MSVLQSLLSGNSIREDLVIEMRHLLAHLRNLEIAVQLCWVPAHIGIKGNEVADKIAKKALKQDHIVIHIPFHSIPRMGG